MKPGEGLGNILIGNSITDVIKKMDSKPDDGKTVKIDSTAEYWLSYQDLGITLIFDDQKELIRIAVKNPAIIVQQTGFRVNSTRTEIERIYGKGELQTLDDVYDQILYKAKGIVFTLNKNTEKVETITIQTGLGR